MEDSYHKVKRLRSKIEVLIHMSCRGTATETDIIILADAHKPIKPTK